jgi:glucosamine kinase
MMFPLFIGVDAGGTNCRARLVDAQGNVLGTGTSGQANARAGSEKVYDAIMTCCMEAVSMAALTKTEVSKVQAGFGIAGISRPGVKEELSAKPFPFERVVIDSDAAIASLGALGGGDGAILIVGTGSVAFIRHGMTTTKIGGYGFPISDEGSGAALGLSAMRHALRALDGRTKPTPLSAAVTAHFEHDTAKAIVWMDSATPADYAKFAPIVMEYAENNDEIAVSIVEDATLHIERFIETIFAKGAKRCVMLGGLSERIRPWLRERTANRLTLPEGDALQGAIYLAGFQR